MSETREAGTLQVDRFFHGMIVPPRRAPCWTGTLTVARGGRIVFTGYDREQCQDGDFCFLYMKSSNDRGRTWSKPWTPVGANGRKVQGHHQTVFRMRSGKLGMVYSEAELFPRGHPGRDEGAGIMFRESADEGRTWSGPTLVYPTHALCCPGHVIVLSSGRIVAPAFRWISHDATGESEEFTAPSLSFSFALVSDDEGKTWMPSLSELFVSHYRAAYDLEEPTAIELSDGRIMMCLRSQLGRIYRSFSEDQGISWSRPEGLPIASAYTPALLKRLPTGELLLLWNQASRQEILTGVHRTRLSCAVSKDEGESWGTFKNLESLDDRTVIQPPPADRVEALEQWEDEGYYQPLNTKRYHRAPGVVRVCYPDVVFVGDEAIVVYDYGLGILGEGMYGIKMRAIPITWFTSRG